MACTDVDRVYYSKTQLQSLELEACGYFSLMWLHWCESYPTWDATKLIATFGQLFHEDMDLNDAVVKKLSHASSMFT